MSNNPQGARTNTRCRITRCSIGSTPSMKIGGVGNDPHLVARPGSISSNPRLPRRPSRADSRRAPPSPVRGRR
eukprot:1191395-Prorocentrum_minimum.AAC.2